MRNPAPFCLALALLSIPAAAGPAASEDRPAEPASPGKIPGYTLGTDAVPTSPLDPEDLRRLERTLLLGEEDLRYLRLSRAVLEPHVDEILDTWYGFVGANPHLLHYFSDRNSGEPDPAYLAAVRTRFGRWILDTASAEHDSDWLDYQYAIGLRHHRKGKNRTDGANAAPHIHFRYLLALHYPITATLRPFLERGGHDAATVEKMHQAWIKSVLLQVILWSQPYVRESDF